MFSNPWRIIAALLVVAALVPTLVTSSASAATTAASSAIVSSADTATANAKTKVTLQTLCPARTLHKIPAFSVTAWVASKYKKTIKVDVRVKVEGVHDKDASISGVKVKKQSTKMLKLYTRLRDIDPGHLQRYSVSVAVYPHKGKNPYATAFCTVSYS